MNNKTFWIINTSNLNVSLRDLALTVKAKANVNLLDSRHYSYTEEELLKSAESGSLFKKSDKIKLRKIPPPKPKKKSRFEISDEPSYRATKALYSRVQIIEPRYEELEISETEFIDQLTDADDNE